MLPPFVQICEETYRGKRYVSKFLDTDYDEYFTANVSSVIQLQHGCKSRSNQLRSKAAEGNKQLPLDINKVLDKIPSFLEMDITTYRGVRYPATFYDKDYKVTFDMIVANILKGKGYCEDRFRVEFSKKITIPVSEIQKRIDKIYGEGELTIIPESYKNTADVCQWKFKNGKAFICGVASVLSGRFLIKKQLERWKAEVFVRDKWKCQKCSSEYKLCAHHINPFTKFPKERLDISNGITLCKSCHEIYHAKFRDTECRETFERWMTE